MKRSLLLITILGGLLCFLSCNNDDSDGLENSSIRERGPQNILDANYLSDFLDNYTYNNIPFEQDNTLDHKSIEFYRIKDDNGNPIILTEQQQSVSNGENLRNSVLSIDVNAFDVNYKLYYIVVRQGKGKEVAISDDILTSFKGAAIGEAGSLNQTPSQALISETPFIDTDDRFWLTGFRELDPSLNRADLSVDGFAQIQAKFKTAPPINPEQPCRVITTNDNGSVVLSDFGVGIMIIPSGLAFYQISLENNPLGASLNPYSNILYTFSLYNNELNDLDNDGIPDLAEGINQSENIIDTDGDGIVNHLDADDDNDGRLTINEIERTDLNPSVDYNCDGVINNDLQLVPFKDTNGNQIPNYLDPTE